MAGVTTMDVASREMTTLQHTLKVVQQTLREQREINKDLRLVANILQKDVDALDKRSKRLLGKLAKKEKLIKELEERVAALQKEIAALENENARLRSILNLNSKNSSKPPSSDQRGTSGKKRQKQESVAQNPAKPNGPPKEVEDATAEEADGEQTEEPSGEPKERKGADKYNGRKPSQKKKGGQPGRTGKTLTVEDVKAMLEEGTCRHIVQEIGTPEGEFKTRFTLDFEVIPIIIEHHFYEDAKIPERLVRSQVVYGENIRAAACFLYTLGGMSNELITMFLRVTSADAIKVSSGAVYGFLKQMARDAEPTLIMLEEELLNEEVINTDATYVVENGGFAYIRNISSPNGVRYVALQRKNRKTIEAIPFFQRYRGILVHDHEIVMYNFGDEHAECNAHGERYLRRNSEETGNSWSLEMETLLYEMNACKKANDGVVPERIRKAFTAQYHALIEKGYEQNKTTKFEYAAKAEKTLLERLKKYAKEHLLFMEHKNVPFSNNQAEQDLRKAKRRSKACGGFREHSGNEMYCALLSVAETAKRKKVPLYETLKLLASGQKPLLFQAA